MLSGFLHLILLAFRGGEWEGDISLRKPILFGISAGVTLLSIAWLSPKLTTRRGDNYLWTALAFAMIVEVALITVQQWRGVPSHFNRSTPLDATILNLIEGLILFVTVVVADLTFRSFGHVRAASDMTIAIRGGMVLLLAGCLLGIFSAVFGTLQQMHGKPPGVFGNAGVMKFAHGMPLHAIQILPLIVFCLDRFGIEDVVRRRAISLSLASMTSLSVLGCVQTFSGRSRFDLSWVSTALLILAAGMLCFAAATVLLQRVTPD